MPKIRIPADVDVVLPGAAPDKDATQRITFVRDFLTRVLLADQRWGQTMEEVFAAMEIRGAFLKSAPGDVVEVGKDHLAKLQERMKNPSAPYVPLVAVQLGPFFDAIMKPEEG